MVYRKILGRAPVIKKDLIISNTKEEEEIILHLAFLLNLYSIGYEN